MPIIRIMLEMVVWTGLMAGSLKLEVLIRCLSTTNHGVFIVPLYLNLYVYVEPQNQMAL
jgi:hypothetical protein